MHLSECQLGLVVVIPDPIDEKRTPLCGVICGGPTTIFDRIEPHGNFLIPVRLDEPLWSQCGRASITLLLCHPDNLARRDD